MVGGLPFFLGDMCSCVNSFASLLGDGLDDYVVVYNDKSANGWLNIDDLNNPTWEELGRMASGAQTQGRVLFADIDGDDKADYLDIQDSGNVAASINQCAQNGDGDVSTRWCDDNSG